MWSFDPHTSGLTAAEGGFETPLGGFGANWALTSNGKVFTATLDVPKGTTGKVRVPVEGSVSVNGKRVQKDSSGVVTLDGGSHSIRVG